MNDLGSRSASVDRYCHQRLVSRRYRTWAKDQIGSVAAPERIHPEDRRRLGVTSDAGLSR